METLTWINISSNTNPSPHTPWSVSNRSLPNSRSIDGARPDARYGHSQFTIDSERILIVGGCGGPNKQFDDAWILHWPIDLNVNCRWERVIVRNLINAPLQFYCVPFVQCCNNKLVTFGKARIPTNSTSASLINEDKNDDKEVMTIFGAVKKSRLRVCSCSDPILPPPTPPSPSSEGI